MPKDLFEAVQNKLLKKCETHHATSCSTTIISEIVVLMKLWPSKLGFQVLDKVPGRTISNLLPSQIVSLHRGESIGHRLTNLGKYDHWFNAGYGMFWKCFSQMWRWYGLGSTSKDLLSVCWKCAKYLRCVDVCVSSCSGAINILLCGHFLISFSCSLFIFCSRPFSYLTVEIVLQMRSNSVRLHSSRCFWSYLFIIFNIYIYIQFPKHLPASSFPHYLIFTFRIIQ